MLPSNCPHTHKPCGTCRHPAILDYKCSFCSLYFTPCHVTMSLRVNGYTHGSKDTTYTLTSLPLFFLYIVQLHFPPLVMLHMGICWSTCAVVSISQESHRTLTPVAAVSIMTVCMLITRVVCLTFIDICVEEICTDNLLCTI